MFKEHNSHELTSNKHRIALKGYGESKKNLHPALKNKTLKNGVRMNLV